MSNANDRCRVRASWDSMGIVQSKSNNWLSNLVLLAMFVLAGCGTPRKPDIILILVDTLRADYLGCYGFQGDISPAIDRLATEVVDRLLGDA